MLDTPPDARNRVILLGASNLTRAFPTVVSTVRSRFGGPVEVYAALGHGRSYGMRSSVLFGARALPGILECGLWDAVKGIDELRLTIDDSKTSRNPIQSDRAEALAKPFNSSNVVSQSSIVNRQSSIRLAFALITDIGNDVLYGVMPEQITLWVEQCIDRLESQGAEVSMTLPPIDSIRRVTALQFRIVKSVMFPTHALNYKQALDRADELHDRISALATRRNIACTAPCVEWYGFDPIHIRRRHWPKAWNDIIKINASSPNAVSGKSFEPSMRDWMRLRTSSPQQWWMWGRECGRKQPAAVLSDGSKVLFF